MDTQKNRILIAELFGTCVLMLGGPGTAILAADAVGILGVALGFGFTLAVLAYVIGPISGCHVNPAVTLGLYMAKKIDKAHATAAVIGQIIGGILGGGILAIVLASAGTFSDRGGFASNGYQKDQGWMGLGAAAIIEIVLTALLIIVVLATTTKKFAPGFGGLVAGLTLAIIHFISIPVDNTSVNPARSLGAAIFADGSSDALVQLWAFIVFPLVGGALGAIIHKVLHGDDA
ncbi:MAG: aquaporin [Actinobacteria bacterium]|nr:aquaporin [Actinomycetota bacterium]